MKRYLKRPDYESNDIEKIKATESIEVDVDTYDDSDDPDDTYYSCSSLDELWRWLNDERH